jgi:NTP pyrophosphatase (non-canonical NTP hydrolase)
LTDTNNFPPATIFNSWPAVHLQEIMELKELERRMHAFVDNKGWYAMDSPKPQTPQNLAISLVLEASEVLEHFQWRTDVRDEKALAGELADVALYLLQLASICGIDLEQAVLDKLSENQHREWPEP